MRFARSPYYLSDIERSACSRLSCRARPAFNALTDGEPRREDDGLGKTCLACRDEMMRDNSAMKLTCG